MAKKRKKRPPVLETSLRVNPEERVSESFDSAGTAKYTVADPERMGFRVTDDCAFEHQM